MNSREKLRNLKYSELRKIAKEKGIRGNLKAEKLIEAIVSKEEVNENILDNNDVRKDSNELKEEKPASETSSNEDINEINSSLKNDKQDSKEFKENISNWNSTKNVEIFPKHDIHMEADQKPDIERNGRIIGKLESKIPKMKSPPGRRDVSSKKPRTPNFARIHQTAFEKMESIDEYVKKKYKRTEELSASVRGSKTLNQLNSSNSKEQQNQGKSSIGTPARKLRRRNFTPHSGIPFIPSGLSNKTFSLATGEKLSKIIRDWAQPNSRENVKESTSQTSNNIQGSRTVFRFGQGTSTPHNSPRQIVKPIFDLKASLAKRLPYKPHAGPLKPLGVPGLKSMIGVTERSTNIQPVPAKIREKNREVLRGVRRNKRFELQMNYRGSLY